jgi:hypothetical protein
VAGYVHVEVVAAIALHHLLPQQMKQAEPAFSVQALYA